MQEEKNVKIHKDVNKDGLSINQKVPKILVEILVYGIYKHKERIQIMLNEIQKQIDNSRKAKNRVRALWYIDKGEKNDEEKKQWLINTSNCKYYLFTPTNYDINSKYITSIVDTVKSLEDAIILIKKKEIMLKKQIEVKVDSETNEKKSEKIERTSRWHPEFIKQLKPIVIPEIEGSKIKSLIAKEPLI